MIREFNFDGLPGLTHHYAGLSHGNLASTKNRGQIASPRTAALQGIAKMRFVAELGIGQAILPPLPRPHLGLLKHLGFRGTAAQIVESAYRVEPALVAAAYSASSMWAANAATVSASTETNDGRLHLTPANLNSLLHRAIESQQTHELLKMIFADPVYFCVHEPLQFGSALSDEGAANHTRLSGQNGGSGLEVYVWGRSSLDTRHSGPAHFPARQTREACQAIARRHQVPEQAAIFLQQNPQAIENGVFHNDVVSVGTGHVFLTHEMAFQSQADSLNQLRTAFRLTTGDDLTIVEISNDRLSLPNAVHSYLFNSQLLQTANQEYTLICPVESQENRETANVLSSLVSGECPQLKRVEFLDLRQSMRNGGGPACLRLRVPLTTQQQQAMHPGVLFSPELDQQLVAWVQQNYRDQLSLDDLRDPKLISESFAATESLGQILGLPLSTLIVDS